MTNNEFELMLAHTCLILFAIIGFLFVCRVLKIVITRKVETKDDFMCLIFLLPFVFGWYYINKKFKNNQEKTKT